MRLRALLIVLALALAGGCAAPVTTADPGAEGSPPSAAAVDRVVTAAPQRRLTVVANADPVLMAVNMSRAVFARAPVVVMGRDDDRAGTLLAASAAVGLGVPLLLQGPDGGRPDPLARELDRLGVTTVLAVGDAVVPAATDAGAPSRDGPTAPEVIGVAAVPRDVARVTGLRLGTAPPITDDGAPAAVAALDPESLVALRPSDQPPGEPPADAATGSLPAVERGAPLRDTVVLTTGGAESTAAIATARAAGATVQLTAGATDPRASPDVVATLAELEPDTVVALGAGFATEGGLGWKVGTAATGTQLPGGGQLLFPGRLLVALYGHPGTGSLGVLGEQGLDASIGRARDTAAAYGPLVDATVVPAFEIIATVAAGAAGGDGNYSNESTPADLRPWVEAAGKAGIYVVLDLQPGRTDFLTQARQYRSLLELPYVGLALDPEWRLGPQQVHLAQIGSVGIDEVNQVVTWLADLTRENSLPQKLLVLHQFRVDMIPGRERLDTSRDELAIMVHADGQGGQAAKQSTWRALHEGAPAPLYWGWKNFYDEDAPVLTPGQTIAQVQPTPELITYQ